MNTLPSFTLNVSRAARLAGLALIASVLATAVAEAQPASAGDPSLVTLDRIFKTKDFQPERFGPARFLDGGASYTTLEAPGGPSTSGPRELIRYDTATGRREVLVSLARLTPKGATAPLEISDYHWSDDGKRLLVFTNTKRVWRINSRGDYWVLDLGSGDLKQIGRDAKPSSLMFAKFTPDGRRVGYVSEHDIYVEDIADGRVVRLTRGGSATLIHGTFDWVYEEELGLRDGFRFSPDGRQVAFWETDASQVKEFTLIDNTSGLYPTLTKIQYPKAGETNSAVRVGVISADGGETRYVDVPGDPRDQYIARMEWAGPGELMLQRLNRLQNTLDVMLADAATGAVRTVHSERDDTWVDVEDDFYWLDKGTRFLWLSESDGWKRGGGGPTRCRAPAAPRRRSRPREWT
jgi:dipeptidyl-peptidase-4